MYVSLPEDYHVVLYKCPHIALPMKTSNLTIKSHKEFKGKYAEFNLKCDLKEEILNEKDEPQLDDKDKKEMLDIIKNNIGAVLT